MDGIIGDKTLQAAKQHTINTGDTGELVKWLQNRLNALGFQCGTADGIAGTKTMNAIKAWQKSKKLGQGYFGGSDWNALLCK